MHIFKLQFDSITNLIHLIPYRKPPALPVRTNEALPFSPISRRALAPGYLAGEPDANAWRLIGVAAFLRAFLPTLLASCQRRSPVPTFTVGPGQQPTCRFIASNLMMGGIKIKGPAGSQGDVRQMD